MTQYRHCFACDLKDNPALIEEYKNYHTPGNIWPEITQSIRGSGITGMEIYLVGNRLFMIMEVDASYSPERKKEMDDANPRVQEWEELMWKYQQYLPWAGKGVKWMPMERIFKLP